MSENLNLCYYVDDISSCFKEDLDIFFEYQDVIQEDLKRISRLVTNCKFDRAQENLWIKLRSIINNITRNRFQDCHKLPLNIRIYGNYLLFSYYKLYENGMTILETPSILIITRDMKNLYFLDKKCCLDICCDDEEQEDDEFICSHYEINYDNDIKENIYSFEMSNEDLFYICFTKPDKMIRKLEINSGRTN